MRTIGIPWDSENMPVAVSAYRGAREMKREKGRQCRERAIVEGDFDILPDARLSPNAQGGLNACYREECCNALNNGELDDCGCRMGFPCCVNKTSDCLNEGIWMRVPRKWPTSTVGRDIADDLCRGPLIGRQRSEIAGSDDDIGRGHQRARDIITGIRAQAALAGRDECPIQPLMVSYIGLGLDQYHFRSHDC
ncbi:MAG: hypothetical protein A3F74_04190 [Betaproteobacteria bacterium RIFCSPLOWO2_12_FULL_62_58]|nr:MAG: hypothetical protein A3F74_04190 [Betaproteobacteria bacterium RIFCSPLOWO2_12_FULL_62_58]